MASSGCDTDTDGPSDSDRERRIELDAVAHNDEIISNDVSLDASLDSGYKKRKNRFKLKNLMPHPFAKRFNTPRNNVHSVAVDPKNVTPTEETPLIAPQAPQRTSDKPAHHRWSKIRALVTSGELLLLQKNKPSLDSEDDHGDVESRGLNAQKAMMHQNDMGFKLGHCLLGFALFIGLSVLVFSYFRRKT